jgi:hypothetical protein
MSPFRFALRFVAAYGVAYGLRPPPTPPTTRLMLTIGAWCALVLIETYLDRMER